MLARGAVVSFFSLFLLCSCSSTDELDTSTAEGAFQLGERYQKDERFEEALVQYNQVKNKHPYSKLATEAELRIADIRFEREEYVEAQNAYQVFKDLHPSHARIDYVTFRIGMSYFNQLPSTTDRDLTLAQKAIEFFDEIMQSHSSSEFAAQAKEHKLKALKMLAEKENYIAHFYFIRDKYESALSRYESLLASYPDLGFDKQALYGAALSAYYIKDMAKAKKYYQALLSEHEKSDEAEKAKEKIGHEL